LPIRYILTTLYKKPFTSGVHYWEIIGLDLTENEMKVGVTTQIPMNFDQAFCDFNDGFAYYGLGQLRNGSNGQGYILNLFLNPN